MREAASRDTQPPLGPTTGPEAGAGRRRAYGAALVAALGFLGGAIFWDALSISLFDPQPGTVSAPTAQPEADALVTGSLPTIVRIDPASCTGLELDRRTNRTVVRPCPPDGLALRLDSGDDREDLAILAAEYETR